MCKFVQSLFTRDESISGENIAQRLLRGLGDADARGQENARRLKAIAGLHW